MDISRFKKNNPNPNKDWLDWWLADDPAPPAIKAEIRQKRVAQANSYRPRGEYTHQPASGPKPADPAEPGLPNVTININLPKVRLPSAVKAVPKLKLPALPYRRLALSAAVLAGLAVIGLAADHWLVNPGSGKARATATADRAAVNIPLNFQPVTPKDRPELGTLTPGKTAYDSTRGVYSMADTFLSTRLTLSQQQIPSTFSSAQQAVASIAASVGARETINTKYGTAYMKSDKSGAQIIVVSVKDLVIFVQSPFPHDAASWKNYLETLQ